MTQQANIPPTYLRKPGVKMKAEEIRGVSLKCKARDKALMYDARDLIEAYPSEMKKIFEALVKDSKPIKNKLKEITSCLKEGKKESKVVEEVIKLKERINQLERELQTKDNELIEINTKLKKTFVTGTERPNNDYIYTEEPVQQLPKTNLAYQQHSRGQV